MMFSTDIFSPGKLRLWARNESRTKFPGSLILFGPNLNELCLCTNEFKRLFDLLNVGTLELFSIAVVLTLNAKGIYIILQHARII